MVREAFAANENFVRVREKGDRTKRGEYYTYTLPFAAERRLSQAEMACILRATQPWRAFSNAAYVAYEDAMEEYRNTVEQTVFSTPDIRSAIVKGGPTAETYAVGMIDRFLTINPPEETLKSAPCRTCILIDTGDSTFDYRLNRKLITEGRVYEEHKQASAIWLATKLGVSRGNALKLIKKNQEMVPEIQQLREEILSFGAYPSLAALVVEMPLHRAIDIKTLVHQDSEYSLIHECISVKGGAIGLVNPLDVAQHTAFDIYTNKEFAIALEDISDVVVMEDVACDRFGVLASAKYTRPGEIPRRKKTATKKGE